MRKTQSAGKIAKLQSLDWSATTFAIPNLNHIGRDPQTCLSILVSHMTNSLFSDPTFPHDPSILLLFPVRPDRLFCMFPFRTGTDPSSSSSDRGLVGGCMEMTWGEGKRRGLDLKYLVLRGGGIKGIRNGTGEGGKKERAFGENQFPLFPYSPFLSLLPPSQSLPLSPPPLWEREREVRWLICCTYVLRSAQLHSLLFSHLREHSSRHKNQYLSLTYVWEDFVFGGNFEPSMYIFLKNI